MDQSWKATLKIIWAEQQTDFEFIFLNSEI